MSDEEFKAGRADILEMVNAEEVKQYEVYADLVNAAYASEQRYGFYTSFDDFAHVHMIYKGTSSTVYIAKCKFSRGKVVLKAYELSTMSGGSQTILKQRVGVMQEMMAPDRYQSSCNDIVRCFGFFEERAEIVFVLEYCARCDIMSYTRGMDVPEANLVIEIVQPVLRCLEHMHSKGFTHGNITPENILLTSDGFVKVTDLDSMTWESDMGYAPSARLQEPSLEYMSPEVVKCYFPLLNEDGGTWLPSESFTPACDIWALGAMVFELCTGQLPFNSAEDDGSDEREQALTTAKKIISEDISAQFLDSISPDAMAFVRFAMTRDMNARPTVEDLMLHPWIQKYSSVEVATIFDDAPETYDELADRGDFGVRGKKNGVFNRFREGMANAISNLKSRSKISPRPKNKA